MDDDTAHHVVRGGSPHEHRAVLAALSALSDARSTAWVARAGRGDVLDAFRRRRRDALRRRPETVHGRA